MTDTGKLSVFDAECIPQYAALGIFHCWFSAVELTITYMLAKFCGTIDTEVFYIVSKGMDARVKCERLKSIASRSTTFGKNFTRALKDFEEVVIPTRNALSHHALLPHPQSDGFLSLRIGKVGEIKTRLQ